MNCTELRLAGLLSGLVLAMLPCAAVGATLHVPGDYPTIQGAVNSAAIGDTVLVGPGTYPENLVIDRRIALISESGPEVTTIDGQDLDNPVFVRIEAIGAVIEGFRTTRGYGAGIHIDDDFVTGAYTTIRRNIVEYNTSFGTPAIFAPQCVVEDNVIQFNNPGGIKGTSALVAWGTIQRNVIRHNGGGFFMVEVHAPSVIVDNLVVDNDLATIAVLNFEAEGVIRNNTIVNNFGNQSAATVFLSSFPSVDFSNNLIVHHGGGPGLSCGLGEGPNTIRCNDVWGVGDHYAGDCAGLDGVDGNFSKDPLFCDAPAGDYHISAQSPCAPNAPGECGLIGAMSVGCGILAADGGGATVPSSRLTITPNPVWLTAELSVEGLGEGGLIEIHDSAGRVVDIAGPLLGNPFQWHPRQGLASGVYFARARGNVGPSTRFVLVR